MTRRRLLDFSTRHVDCAPFQVITLYAFIIMAIVSLSFSSACGAELVYSSVNLPSLSSAHFTALEIGNQVQLAGTARTLTDFQLVVTPQSEAVTADLQVRFYANDGAGGTPGTLLGQTPTFQDVQLSGQLHGVGWGGLQLDVPDSFTWTVEITNAVPIAVGLPVFAPPTQMGQHIAAWFGSPESGWTPLLNNNGQPPLFAAAIFAVPEPSTYLLAVTAVAGAIVILHFHKRRHSNPIG